MAVKQEVSYCVGDWLAIKDMAQLLPKAIAKAIPEVLKEQEARLLSSFRYNAKYASSPNKRMTLLLKNSVNPLVDSGALVGRTKFTIIATSGGAIWGVSPSTKLTSRASVSTRFKSFMDLIVWLNGSDDLMKPRMRMVTVTPKVAKLFATVAGALRARKLAKAPMPMKGFQTRANKTSKRKQARQLIGRAKQMFDVLNKGGIGSVEEFKPPRAGTVMTIAPRSPFMETYKDTKPVLVKVAINASAKGVMQALADAQARYKREAGQVWGHNGQPIRKGR